MSETGRALAIDELVPDVRLQAGDGGELGLATLRGRPLVVVCVRYYG